MNLEEIKALVAANKDSIWHEAVNLGRDPKIYLHWTAGDYDTDYSDYHFCIRGDGTVTNCHGFDSPVAATSMRNSGSVAVALNCCSDAVAYADESFNLGSYPPTDSQIECLAQVVAVISETLGVPIDLQHVMTHAEAADNLDGLYPCDPYGPSHGCERWDLLAVKNGDAWMSGGDIIRGKALFYRNQGV